MTFEEMNLEQVKSLPLVVKNWLITVISDNHSDIEIDAQNFDEEFASYCEDYNPVMYLEEPIADEDFNFDDEYAIVIVKGNVSVKTLSLFGTGHLLILGDVTVDTLLTQDCDITILGNLTAKKHCILCDDFPCLEVSGTLSSPLLLNLTDSDEGGQFISVENWDIKSVGVFKNSSGIKASQKLLQSLGFEEINVLTDEDMEKIWSEVS